VWDLAIDDSGYIYTTEDNQHRIQKFNAQGNFIKSWQIPTDRGGGMACLAVHDTILYITYVYSSEVISYSTKGDSVGSFILPTEISGFGYGGWDITTNKQGNIYVAVLNGVYILDSNGNLIKSFLIVPGSSTDPGALCIATDATGDVFVACGSDKLIRVYGKNGNYIAKWGAAGAATGQFTSFSSMIMAPDNSVFVSDGDLGRIQKFTRNK
jgi:tripartite motif-containing protein 71